MSKASDPRVATLSGRPAEIAEGPAPAPVDPATGMHKDYWVLSKEERAKGFVRRVRVGRDGRGRRVMSKMVPAVDAIRLGASTKHNVERLEVALRVRMNAGWTLRSSLVHDGVSYLMFAKKEKVKQ